MKNIITILCLVCTSSFFAQSTASIKGNAESMKANKEAGVFEIFLSDVTEAAVVANAANYKSFFTTEFYPTMNLVKIVMVKNTPEARRVIVRFMGSVKNNDIMFDGKSISIEDFYTTHLN